MTISAPSTALIMIQPITDAERLARFWPGTALDQEAYALTCGNYQLRRARSACPPSAERDRVLRPGAGAKPPGCRHPWLCTIAGFYGTPWKEELLDHSPAAHVRRPRVDYEVARRRPGPQQLGALLVGWSAVRAR
jgi:hypothetical protein